VRPVLATPAAVEAVEFGELDQPDCRADIGEVHLAAPFTDVQRAVVEPFDPVKTNSFNPAGKRRVRACDGAAFDRGHVFVGMKTETHRIAR